MYQAACRRRTTVGCPEGIFPRLLALRDSNRILAILKSDVTIWWGVSTPVALPLLIAIRGACVANYVRAINLGQRLTLCLHTRCQRATYMSQRKLKRNVSRKRFGQYCPGRSLRVERLERREMLTAIVSGQTISAAITVIGHQDMYTFMANAGDSYELSLGDADSTTAYQPFLTIYGPTGTQIGSQSSNSHNTSVRLIETAAATGTYTAVVQDTGFNGFHTGAYALEMVRVPATQQADSDGDGGTLVSGQTKSGSIQRLGDVDIYTFTANAGDSYELSLGDADSTTAYQPFLTIYGPTGTQIGSQSSNSHNTSVRLIETAAATGTYTAVVQDTSFNGSDLGAYTLEMVRAPATQQADSDGDGGTFVSGQTKSGSIQRLGDVDIYTFTANVGDNYELSLGDADANTPYQPFLTIYGPTGTSIASKSSSAHNTSVRLIETAAATGTYTAVVQDTSFNGSDLGAYTLEMVRVPATQQADSDGDGGTLVSGQTKSGSIQRLGDVDIYTFTANAGDSYELSLGDADANTPYQPFLTIYGPTGTQIGSQSSNSHNTSVRLIETAAATGTYTAVVQDTSFNGSDLGAYTLEMVRAPATQQADSDGDGGTFVSGQTKSGSIQRLGDVDIYTFTANAGDSYELSLGDADANTPYQPFLTIYGPTGTSIASKSSSAHNTSVRLIETAAATGTYTAVVQDTSFNGSDLGAYTLEMVRVPATQQADSDGDGGTLVSGQTKSGSIQRLGDVDIYTFTANAGDSYELSLGDADANTPYQPFLTIYGPTGTQIGSQSSNSHNTSVRLIETAAATGTYTAVVQDTSFNGSDLGAYTLEMVRAPATQQADSDGDGGTFVSGQTKSGSIQRLGDVDIYTFTANAGDSYELSLGDADANTPYQPFLTIYGPTGTQIGSQSSNSHNTSVRLIETAAATGTYTAVVQDTSFNGYHTGAYNVAMLKAPSTGQIDGSPLAFATTVLGRLSTGGESAQWTFFGQSGRSVTLVANPGASGTFLVPFSPFLNWASVSLIAPDGTTILASANSTSSGQIVSLTGIKLPADGTYTVEVSTAAGHSSQTGNYVLNLYDATAMAQSLDLNRSIAGNIASPFAVQQWTFSAAANSQIQFNLTAGSAGGLTYSLTGPNGIPIFGNITASTGLVNLPADGTYTLSVQGPTGQFGKYGFNITQTSQTSLALGNAAAGTITGNDQSQLYAIPITSSDPVSIVLTDFNPSDHNELYASFGSPPTRQTYDYGISVTGANQSLLVPSAKPGTLYVLVYNESVKSAPGHFTLQVQSAAAIITASTPSRGTADASTTLTITGAGFKTGAVVSLAGNGTAYAATSSSVDLPTQITAIFVAGSVPTGTYSVSVTQNGHSTTLPNAFTMVASGAGVLSTHLEIPNPIGNHIAATLYVDYSNTGTVAIPAPLLTLDASRPSPNGSGMVHGALMTLDPTLITSGFWTSATPQGYSRSVQILASGKTPGVLQPGESVRVPVYYAGWLQSQWNFVDTSINFSLSAVQPNDTTTVNWNTTLASLQPATIGATAWSIISLNLLTKLGTTAGTYVQMLDNAAAYLGHLGENVTDVQSLWSFELQQADAAISAVGPILTSATDDTVAAPGISISFDRLFSDAITGRNSLGLLGYGWATPWEAHATAALDGPNGTKGTVTIFGPGNSEEVFQPDGRHLGTYFSSTGDHNSLTSDGAGGYLLTAPGGNVTDFSSDGTLHYVQDTNENRITADYTGGRLSTLMHSSGQSLTIAYNANGLISSITDSVGRTITYAYNASRQLTSVTDQGMLTTGYAYAATTGVAANALATITSPGSIHSYFTYDSQGRLAGTHADGNAEALVFSYNEGAVTATDALTESSTEYFDNHGQLAKSVDALGNANYATYDANFNLVKVTGPTGLTENYTYDSNGNVLTSTDALDYTTQFVYGANGRLTSFIDAKHNQTAYAYDSAGDLLSTTYADNTKTIRTFDPLGEPMSFVNQNGQLITYSYNAAGQLTQGGFSDGTSYSYTYDTHGNLQSAVDATGTTTFSYDNDDRLTKVTYPGNLSLAFMYNLDGQRTQMVDQTGFTTNYHYDTVGRLSSLTDGNGNPVVTYTYDATGRLSRKGNGNGTSTTYTYDKDGNVLHLINYAPDGTSINSRFDYTYDALNNVATEAMNDGTWTYSYDADGQLTRAVFVSINPNVANQDLSYNYDAVGNRTTTVTNGVITTYTTNNMNEYSSVGGIAYTYDAAGNLLNNGTSIFTYSLQNRIQSTHSGQTTETFVYNSLGFETSYSINGAVTQNLVDPANGVNTLELATGGAVSNRFLNGIGLVEQISQGNPYYVDFDQLGNMVALTTSAGVLTTALSYTPFGSTLSSTGVSNTTLQFGALLGVRSIDNIALEMGTRIYLPSIGRFTQPDSLDHFGSGDSNLYNYALNRPTQFADPTGTNPLIIGGAAIGGIFGAASYVYTHGASGESFSLGGFLAATGVGIGQGAVAGATGGLSLEINFAAGFAGSVIADSFDGKNVSESLTTELQSGVIAALPIPEALEWLGVEGIQDIEKWGAGNFGKWLNTALGKNGHGRFLWQHIGLGTAIDDVLQQVETLLGSSSSSSVSSRDPNRKIGPSGYGLVGYVADTGTLPYTIEFENASSATAPAQEVNVTDQLSSDLDWSTFQLTQIGFGDINVTVAPGTQSYQTTVPMTYAGQTFNVLIEAGIHTATGQVYANFYSLDPSTGLPPSVIAGFLPPEDGSGRGQGYISYTVAPNANLPNGTQITNIANIVFDGNPPISTDQKDENDPNQGLDPAKQTLLTIDSVAPTSSVNPLPSQTSIASFNLSWSGADPNGSAIAGYSIYVSDNGAPTTAFLLNTTAISAVFNGVAGHTYAFYSIATDNVGNTELPPTSPDAQTVIQVGNPPTGDYSTNGVVNAGDYVLWRKTLGSQTNLQSDGSHNGVVDAADYGVWRTNFGKTSAPVVAGDYNNSGVVDASDFVLWRKTQGSQINLQADGSSNGVVDAADYSVWRSNFGKTITPAVSGDYTSNGLVNAADYVLWRKTLGSQTSLQADGSKNGVVDATDYTIWRNNFGRAVIGGAGTELDGATQDLIGNTEAVDSSEVMADSQYSASNTPFTVQQAYEISAASLSSNALSRNPTDQLAAVLRFDDRPDKLSSLDAAFDEVPPVNSNRFNRATARFVDSSSELASCTVLVNDLLLSGLEFEHLRPYDKQPQWLSHRESYDDQRNVLKSRSIEPVVDEPLNRM